MDGIEHFIGKRIVDAEEWLGIRPPRPPVVAMPTLRPVPLTPDPGPRLRIGRTKVTGHFLRTRLNLVVPGVITQFGTIATRRGTVTVCRGRAEVEHSRSLILRCELNAKARARLLSRWLAIKLTTRFDPTDGAPESATRLITVPRR